MYANLYQIKLITNMHVGSGDVNYNIVDNEVERDPVTGSPTINSSGVKGAIREHMTNNSPLDRDALTDIFGQDNKTRTDKDGNILKPTDIKPGSYKFFNAGFLARPLRVSEGKRSNILVTSPDDLKSFAELISDLGCKAYDALKSISVLRGFAAVEDGICIEGERAARCELDDTTKALIKDLLGNETFALSNELNEYELPVLARNFLENGISKNLWYEEIVPHGSVFYTVIITPDKECRLDDEFKRSVVQFGANASIGYGLTKITKLNSWEVSA